MGAVVAILLIVATVAFAAAPRASTPAATAATSLKATPTAQSGMWRVQGTITDTQKQPIEGVCVGVGPAVCTPTNPRSDSQGHWFIDFPAVSVEYDLHFTKDGYQPGATRVKLTGPQILGVVLTR